jgi:hypothetical protein
MAEIVKQKSKVGEVSNGDILYGEHYLKNLPSSLKKLAKGKKLAIPVDFNEPNAWKVLHNVGVTNAFDVMQEATYRCPFIKDNKYFWFVPQLIITSDISKYENIQPHWRDTEFLITQGCLDKNWILQDPYNMLGHGYTDFTLPTDGSSGRSIAIMELDDGDIVVVATQVWYNK